MKISVVTSEDGNVVATMRHEEGARQKDQPAAGFVTGRGQRVYELDLPAELEALSSADELHQALKTHISKTKR